MYHIYYIHSSVEGHLGSFQLLAIMNKAAMNIVEHVSLLHVGASSGYMPWSDIAGSSGSILSNFLRNHQTDFQSGCPSLQSDQQWRNTPPLLMGLQAGTTTLEISLVVPQKIGHSTNGRPSITSPGNIPRRISNM